MQNKIDFILTWVDGNDPNWQAEKHKHEENDSTDNREIRYRGLDSLKYWFRGVEKHASWINKIHFVTWGHLPEWLNIDHPKLNIVKHTDFIPEKYLPTFSSHTIELNLHRIEGLSDKFVYFNDDIFIMKKMKAKDFFHQGLPKDIAVLKPNISSFRQSTSAIEANNLEVINTIYDKNKVIKRNFKKWFSLKYKKQLFSTLLLMPYGKFPGFLNQHLPNSYLKETYVNLWENEYEVLDKTCQNKFRNGRDVNQWLFKYTQLVEGDFKPKCTNDGKTYSFTNNNEDIYQEFKEKKHKMICINDNDKEPIIHFEKEKIKLISKFKTKFPKKSDYEK